jgi:hypothetical protein
VGYKDPERQRAYQLKWITRRRDAWIAANGPCALCGSETNLEVDHTDPAAKAIPVSGLWSLAPARAAAELAKCRVLCERCHAAKSATECFRGEKVATAKLVTTDITAIRASPLSPGTLAAIYGVHPSTIHRVLRRQAWVHVEDAALALPPPAYC